MSAAGTGPGAAGTGPGTASTGAGTTGAGPETVASGPETTGGGPETAASGLTAGGPAVSGDRAAGPPGPPDTAGRLLRRLSVLPVLLAVAWLLAGLPLLILGLFTPVLTLVVAVPLAAVLVVLGLRWTPRRWQSTLPGQGEVRTPWWAFGGVLAVAVAFGVLQLIYHSQQIIVQIDPGSYMQTAAWIAHHGSLPIPQTRAAFGGTHGVLHFSSAAFFQVGGNVVPQFMTGMPMVVAAGFWIGGASAAVLVAPLLGACGVLTFGGLAARLAGPRWAPLAALALALSLPEQFTSRSSYSEPLAQIIFLGGLCLVIDSLASDGAGARVIAALGGLALGLTLLVRIDGVSDILLVIPYGGILLLARRPQAVPLLAGLAAGALCGAVDGLVLSRPYLDSISRSLKPLGALVVLVVVLTAVAVLVLRGRGVPQVRSKWLLNMPAVLAVLILLGLAARPYLSPLPRGRHGAVVTTVTHASPLGPYWALSLDWVFWYIGIPAVLLGAAGAALLGRRCLQGRAPAWTLPLMVFAWIIVTVLLRPEIVPTQPWASRRLVPGVLPGFILLAVWMVAWLVGWLHRNGYGRAIRGGLAAVCAAALLLPAATTSFGLGLRHGGPLGIRPVARGLAFKTTYAREVAAVSRMCAALPPRSAVVILDPKTVFRFTEVVRGMCGHPAAWTTPGPGRVPLVVAGIRRAGRQPVLLAASPALLKPYGGAIRQIVNLRITRDSNIGTAAPLRPRRQTVTLWMSEPAR
jgi:hypothetical protein